MKWSLKPVDSLYAPTQEQWNGLKHFCRKHAIVVAVIINLIGLHFISPLVVSWNVVIGVSCFVIAMIIVRWGCQS